MSDKLRGLTIPIDIDPQGFNKKMRGVRREVKDTQKEFDAINKSLRLNFDDKKFKSAQAAAQAALDKTSGMVDTLRQRLKYLEDSGNIDTSHYRELKTQLAQAELQAETLQAQLEQLNNLKFENLGNKVQDVGGKISKAGQALAPFSAAATAAIAGTFKLTKDTAAAGAAIDDFALRLGISAEKWQEYSYITQQCGVDTKVFEKALIKARAAAADLGSGTINTTTKALEKLHINVNDFENSEQMFDGILNALTNVEDKTMQTALANEIFGDKIAHQMLPYLNTSTKEIEKFRDEFGQMSYLTNEQVANLAQLDDSFFELKESTRYCGMQIGVAFMPLLKEFNNMIKTSVIPKIQKLAQWFGSLSIGQQKAATKLMIFVAALAPMLLLIGKVTTAVGGLIKILPALGAGLSKLAANPIILIIAAVIGLLTILYNVSDEFKQSINELVSILASSLSPVIGVIQEYMQNMLAIMAPIWESVGSLAAIIITLLSTALSPILDMFNVLINLLKPFVSVVLLPMQLAFTALQVPLQLLGSLLGWLTPLFVTLANVVKSVFGVVLKVINFVLKQVEKAINWCIGVINGLIDGINAALGWTGVDIARLGEVSLQINTEALDNLKDVEVGTVAPPSMPAQQPNTVYDVVQPDVGGSSNTTIGNDYSTNNNNINITVNIDNANSDIDPYEIARVVNMELSKVM